MSSKWLPPKELGKRVLELRNRLGASQPELAALVGRPGSQAEISKLERGKWRGEEPNTPLLAKIAEVAGESLAYFREARDSGEEERREKMIAAQWMRRMADYLQQDAALPDWSELTQALQGIARDVLREGGGRMGHLEFLRAIRAKAGERDLWSIHLEAFYRVVFLETDHTREAEGGLADLEAVEAADPPPGAGRPGRPASADR